MAPGPAHPHGLEPIYLPIPSWPRKLMILQLAALYCYTGVVKTGGVWARGDAFYYAWNLDHFYRVYPQHASAVFGTNVFRLMTWVTHWWEVLFPLVVVSLVARWAARERIAMTVRARWLARALWVGFGLTTLMIVVVAYPVHFYPRAGGLDMETERTLVIAGWLLGMLLVGWGWWRLAHRPFRPERAEILARHWWLWPVVWPIRLFNRVRGSMDPLDLDWFSRWVLGRRVWLVLGLTFHAHLAALMNIGMFPLIMMATYIAYLDSPETDLIVRRLRTAAARVLGPFAPGAAIPPADAGLPRFSRDALVLPAWTLWSGLVLVAVGVVLAVPRVSVAEGVTGLGPDVGRLLHAIGFWQTPEFLDFVLLAVGLGGLVTILAVHGPAGRHRAWALCGVLIVVVGGLLCVDVWEFRAQRPGHLVEIATQRLGGVQRIPADPADPVALWLTRAALRLALIAVAGSTWLSSRRLPMPQLSAHDEVTARVRPPWAHGPAGRLVIGFGIIWHITAVAVWLSPEKDSLSAFRPAARRPFSTWMVSTHTDQSWGMFAPNPPRMNVFHKVLVTDRDGEIWDLRTDLYAPERKPIPWIWNDRMRKMNRRMSGGESGGGDWYQKWFARWLCRDWAFTHEGVEPAQIELIKVSYKIPTPEQVRDVGWYFPEDLMEKTASQESLYVEKCDEATLSQLSDEIRARHGLPPLEAEYRDWIKHRKRNWDRAHGIGIDGDGAAAKARIER